jgi:hypothetical protein
VGKEDGERIGAGGGQEEEPAVPNAEMGRPLAMKMVIFAGLGGPAGNQTKGGLEKFGKR